MGKPPGPGVRPEQEEAQRRPAGQAGLTGPREDTMALKVSKQRNILIKFHFGVSLSGLKETQLGGREISELAAV